MREVKLGDYIKLSGGGTPSKNNPDYWNGDIPWASVKDLKEDILTKTIDSITKNGLDNCPSSLIPAGTLIVSTRMAVGKAVITAIDTAINQDLKAVYTSEKLDKKFLFYLFKAKEEYFNSVATGATVQGIKISHLKGLKFTLPPLPVQRRIAAALDLADRQRQLLRAEIAAYGELGESLFLEMFGDVFSSYTSFKKKRLVEVVEKVQIGPFGAQLHKSDYIEGGHPVINPTHIVNGNIVPNCSFTVPSQLYRELPQYHLQNGDVIMGRRGEMGRCGIVKSIHENCLCGTGSLYVRANKKRVNPIFIQRVLSSPSGVRYLENEAKGVTMLNLNKTIIQNIKIALPEIELQNEFANRIQKIEALKAQAESALAEADDLFNVLLQRAFRGELFKERVADRV